MQQKRSKIIAIITGLISISICLIYLILITFFDSRDFLNEYLTNLSEGMGVIFYLSNIFYFF